MSHLAAVTMMTAVGRVSWWWRRQCLWKQRYTSTGLCDVIFQQTTILLVLLQYSYMCLFV